MRYNIAQHNAEREISLPDAEIAAKYAAGETVKELAAAYCVSRPTLSKALDRMGVQRRAAKRRPGKGTGADNSAWKGGRRTRRDGYVVIWTPEGEILEHRKVVADTLGRPLKPEEIVHHRDGNRQNNEPANLQVMTQSEHARHHAPEMHAARYSHGR